MIFNKIATIPERIEYFDTNTGWDSLLLFPLVIGTVLAVGMPWANLLFAKAIAGAKTGHQNLALDTKRATLIKRREIAEEEKKTLEAESAIDIERLRQEQEKREIEKRRKELEEVLENKEFNRRSEQRKKEEKEDIKAYEERFNARRNNELIDQGQMKLSQEAVILLNQGKPLPMKFATSLKSLFLGFTSSLDIKALLNLENLEMFNFIMENGKEDNLKNWKEIQKFKNLKILTIENSNITDLAPLKSLTKLEFLCLDNSNVANLAPLAKLTNLKKLYLNFTNVSDLTPLEKLVSLEELNLVDVKVSDWSPVDHVENVDGRPKDWKRKNIKN